MIAPETAAKALAAAHSRLGQPYLLGAKWDLANPLPVGPIDCSGFACWVLAQAGITLPEGSYNQIKVCEKLTGSLLTSPPPLCLGFFSPEGTVDHVVIAYDSVNVIEARGAPYNAVIERPIQKWLNQAGFLGFYAPPGLL